MTVEARLRLCEAVMSTTGDFVCLLDPSARFIYANAAFVDRWGLSQVAGKSFFELDYPVDLGRRHEEEVEQVISTKEPLQGVVASASDAGQAHYFEYDVRPLLDNEERVEAVAIIGREITQERELRRRKATQERLLRTLKAAKLVVWEWDTDKEELITYPSAKDTEGAPFSEALDREWSEYAEVHPEDEAELRRKQKRALETGESYRHEYRLRHPEREEWRWLEDVGKAVEDEQGRRLVGVLRDVTASRRTKERLEGVSEESKRCFRMHEAIVSTTPDLAFVFSVDGRLLYANDATLAVSGRTWNEVVGKKLLNYGSDREASQEVDDDISRVVATKKPLRGERVYKGARGARVYEYIMSPVFDEDGEVEAVAGTARDVTEHRRAREKLEKAAEQKNRFLAVLSHELRNPLVPLRLGLHVLKGARSGGEKEERAYQTIERQIDQLTRLVDDLLDLTRISRNKLQLKKEELELNEVVEKSVEDHQALFSGHEVELVFESAEEEIFVDGDVSRIVQAVGNLLQNAVKFTDPGGVTQVWLESKPEDEEVEIHIRDDGVGIDPEEVCKLFRPFEQSDAARKNSSGGLGLGLALVKSVVEMHGGEVRAQSEGPGMGAEFVVRLPAKFGPKRGR